MKREFESLRLDQHNLVLDRVYLVQNYTVVQARNMPELITKVNALITMGWQPQGSIAVDPVHGIYLQAMWTEMK